MNNKWIVGFVVCGVFALAISCGKKEEAPPSAAQTEASKPAVEVPKAAEATPAPAPAPAPAASVTSQATDMANAAIAKAQTLIADKKYSDALTTLQSLAGQTLSPEHKAMVDNLITQAQQAMAKQAASSAADSATSQASKTLGNLLGGSK